MISRVLLSAVSGIALVSSAFAADIYSPGPANYAPVALPPNWGGFYLGVNGGYGGNNGNQFRDDVFFPGGSPDTSVYPTAEYSHLTSTGAIAGGFGGGQLGYNFQAGNFVYGFETDIQGANIMGSSSAFAVNPTTDANPPYCGATGSISSPTTGAVGVCSAKNDLQVDYFGTIRARLGYAFGGTLIYATGGFAYGGVRSSASYVDNSGGLAASAGLPLNARTSNTSTATGWVAGAGIEYKISPNWSLKGEYQYIDLGSGSDAAVPAVNGYGSSIVSNCAPGNSSCTNLRGRYNEVAFNTVRVGVNYYFNTPYEPLK